MKEIKCTYSRAQKIWSWAALIGIFVCGVMTGISVWGYKHAVNKSVDEVLAPCQVREQVLKDELPRGGGYGIHENRAKVYKKLVELGCPENKDYFQDMVATETQLAGAIKELDGNNIVEINTNENRRPCEVIENTLLERLRYCDDSECHLDNANVYAKIAEDGCVERAEEYSKKALDELQIAEGVRVDENEVHQYEMRTTVNTYKKLQMQNEARKYIKKMEKLVNPGVDFIMELQRVIEE